MKGSLGGTLPKNKKMSTFDERLRAALKKIEGKGKDTLKSGNFIRLQLMGGAELEGDVTEVQDDCFSIGVISPNGGRRIITIRTKGVVSFS